MEKSYKIRLAARCEAAGRAENEDNYQIAEDLSAYNVGFTTDKVFSLSSKGTLLLVCDGMGGMNAGEVASAIGVETIKNLFAPQLLTSDVLANDNSICDYMKRAIIKADSQIKEEASKDEAKHGMGSTAVMAWLLGHKVYVTWCGDSRCYRYNPATGLEQLSHDHSYVQDLVDTGQLMPELAFDHPNKNIITRSLGDPRGAARPDARVYDLHAGDVILLCSDGLSDSLRDEEIEQSISRSLSSMAVCRDSLWNDSKQAGWHDNVTILLAQVIDERAALTISQPNLPPPSQTSQQIQDQQQSKIHKQGSNFQKRVIKMVRGLSKYIRIIAIMVIILCCGGLGWYFYREKKYVKEESDQKKYEQLCKSIENAQFTVLAEQVEDTIKKTIDYYNELVQLEKSLNIEGHKQKSDDYKKNINEKIIERELELNAGDPNEGIIANKINEYIIK